MAARVLQIDSIVSDPSVRGGSPVLAGTTLRVSDLATYHLGQGLSPQQLAEDFDLDLGQVYAALAYFYQHRDEIETEIRQNEQEAEHWRRVLEAQGRLRTLA